MLNILLFSVFLVLHPVHVSLLSVDYDPDRESFNLFLKIYYDDFLLDSGFKTQPELIHNSVAFNSSLKDGIMKYTNEKVKIIVNDQLFIPHLENLSLNDNELSLNMSIKIDRKISVVTIKNLIMTSLYNDQANMVILRVNDYEEGIKLTPERTEQTFKIK